MGPVRSIARPKGGGIFDGKGSVGEGLCPLPPFFQPRGTSSFNHQTETRHKKRGGPGDSSPGRSFKLPSAWVQIIQPPDRNVEAKRGGPGDSSPGAAQKAGEIFDGKGSVGEGLCPLPPFLCPRGTSSFNHQTETRKKKEGARGIPPPVEAPDIQPRGTVPASTGPKRGNKKTPADKPPEHFFYRRGRGYC